MPEGPETKRMADTIKSALVDKEIVSAKFLHPSLEELSLEKISINDITSKGKAVLIRLKNNKTIVTHNQLYGRWTSNLINTKINHNRSLRVEFITRSKAVRLWSATDISLYNTEDENNHPYIKNLGPDVLEAETTYQVIYDRLTSKKFRNRQFSGTLLNQNFIAGLGNYLRSEILFFSKIMYNQNASQLTDDQNELLSKNIKDVSMRTYRQKGKTIFFDDLMLKKLDKQAKSRRFMVFARESLPCYNCDDLIIKVFTASRRLYYCPNCQ